LFPNLTIQSKNRQSFSLILGTNVKHRVLYCGEGTGADWEFAFDWSVSSPLDGFECVDESWHGEF